MSAEIPVSQGEIDILYHRLKEDAEAYGYHLNPDRDFTKQLVQGILQNQKRLGYWNCPCRLPSGDKHEDLDIICPCDYRDQDITEYGSCF